MTATPAIYDTTPALGPDGTPLVDDPVVAAERASKLADELAALVEQLLAVLAWQDAALARIRPGTPVDAGHLADARHVNARSAGSLTLVRDSLGEQHVSCDELATQLRRLLPAGADDRPGEGR